MARDLIKLSKMLLISFVLIYLVFPLVHEGGHAFFSILAGAEVLSVEIFPTPSVLCSSVGLETFEILFIGSGGMVMTFLFSVIFNFKKNFYLWYSGFFFRMITSISLLISCVSSVLWGFGISLENEDAVIMLNFCNPALYPIILGTALLLFFTVMMIKRDDFIKRIGEFFNIGFTEKTKNYAKENEGHKI